MSKVKAYQAYTQKKDNILLVELNPCLKERGRMILETYQGRLTVFLELLVDRNHSTRVIEIWHKPQLISSIKTDIVGFLRVLGLIRLTFIHSVQHFHKSNDRISIIK